ncbi:MAG: anthrone oxygenase family protein [Gammaproteobacteria bacterium]
MAITGAAIITGLLFAFSNFVMRALADLPNDKGMFAMQRVNERILNPVFLILFLGTPTLCALIAFKSAQQLDSSGSLLLFIGALAYFIGPFGITVLFNVPLNNKLAEAEQSVADDVWPVYQKKWLYWNHFRTCIGVVSIVLLAAGLGTGEG